MSKAIRKIKVDELDEEKNDIVRYIYHYLLKKRRTYVGLDMCDLSTFMDYKTLYENDSKQRIIVKNCTFQFNIPTFSSFNRLKVLDFIKNLLAPGILKKYIEASILLEGGKKDTNNYFRSDMLFFIIYIFKVFKEQLNSEEFRYVDFKYISGDKIKDIPRTFEYDSECYLKQNPQSLILEKDLYLNQFNTSSNFISIDKNIKLRPNECIASELLLFVSDEIASKAANPNLETICFSKFEIEEP